ncbi:MAG TPA: hypothetical protein VGE52_11535, partial [Pirellulales bacterium]
MADGTQTSGWGAILTALAGLAVMGVVGAFKGTQRHLHFTPSGRATGSLPHFAPNLVPGLARQSALPQRLADSADSQATLDLPPTISSPSATPAPPEAFSLALAADADEALFYVRYLEVLLASEALVQADKSDMPEIAYAMRRNLAQTAEAVHAAALDPAVAEMYAEGEALLKSILDGLMDLGLLERNYEIAAAAQSQATAVRATESAATTGGGLLLGGADPWTAGGAAVVQAALVGLEHSAQADRLEARREAEVRRRVDELALDVARRRSRFQTAAEELAERRGWTRVEVGFLEREPRATRLEAAQAAGDFVAVDALLDELIRSRPRDPFLLCGCGRTRIAQAEALAESQNPRCADEYDRAAADFRRAAERAPAGRRHDPFRVACLSAFAHSLNLASYHRRVPRSLAVAVCDAALALDPADASGELRGLRAEALARAGRAVEGAAAFEELIPVLGRRGDVLYTAACLRSLAGDPDGALAALREARRLGVRDVRGIRRDFDLDAVRAAHPQEFAELVLPKWEWRIEYGVLQNDVVVVNASDFDFTGVLLEVSVASKSGPTQRELLWVDRLAAGATHRFSAALDGRLESQTRAAATQARLFCWESPPARATPDLDEFDGDEPAWATRLDGGWNSAESGRAFLKVQ